MSALQAGPNVVSQRSQGVDEASRLSAEESLRARVVLIKPPIRVPKASYTTLTCPPLGLAYLAASLIDRNVDVSIVDAVGEAPGQSFPMASKGFLRVGLRDDELVARIPGDATLIGVTCMFSEEWPLVRSVIQAIRAAFPRTPIVAGGEHATAAPEFTMRDCPGVDVCVLGEGEETLTELVSHVASRRPIDKVAGIAYLQNGVFRRTPARARIGAVDGIPRPAWHLVPLENYLRQGLGYGLGGKRTIPILATRGCPFQCTFCSSPQMWTTKWAARDPDELLAEMRWGVEKFGADDFDFYDLTAILRKDWIITFCRKLIDSGLKVTWQIPSGTRSEALDEDVLPLLRASGCRYFAYAPESGSPALLKRIKKRVHLDRMKASMRAAVAASLNVKCNIIVGFPTETRREVWETVRFCLELASIGVHDVNVVPFCPYPGSELFDELLASGRIAGLGEEYFDMLSMYSDLTRTVSWSEHISNRELAFIRFIAFAGFYGSVFLLRPGRLTSVLRNFIHGRQETRLDRALGDLWRRRRRSSAPA